MKKIGFVGLLPSNRWSILVCWVPGVIAGAAGTASASYFTPGDLVVETYGTSSYVIYGAATRISLVEYSPLGGGAILTDTLPNTDGVGASNNLGIVGQYHSATEGNMQLSADGTYLTFAGYSATAAAAGIDKTTNTANGTNYAIGSAFGGSDTFLAQSTDTNVPRVTAFVDYNGNVNSSTVLNNLYNTNNPRSVYSASAGNFYISGQGDGATTDQGIFLANTGINTVTKQGASPASIYNAHDTRVVTAYNNNLYFSIDTSSGKYTGIWQYTGMPTSSASTPVRIIPSNNGSGVYYSPQGFYFANSTTLYVADTGLPKAGAVGDGGIQKWVYNNSVWTLAYTMTPTTSNWIPAGNPKGTTYGETGFAGLTGEVVGSGASAQVELFAISEAYDADEPDGLYSITDTLGATSGVSETFSELETAPSEGYQSFKGIAFAPVAVPEPVGVSILLTGVALLGLRRRRRTPLV